MDVQILQLIDGAKDAKELTVFDFVLKVKNDGSIKYLQKVRVTEKTNTITR